jgi:hypothetical protein
MGGHAKRGVLVAHRRGPAFTGRTVREKCLTGLKEGYCGLRRAMPSTRPEALIGEDVV